MNIEQPERQSVAVITATYRRAEAIQVWLPQALALQGVSEIVVVLDGPDADTARLLSNCRDDRLRFAVQPHQGVQAARRHGIDLATSDWIFLLDDDDGAPPSHILELVKAAERHQADVVGSPWMPWRAGRSSASLYEEETARPHRSFNLYSPPWSVPFADAETPFLPALVLMRREVAAVVFASQREVKGNAWREETQMFLQLHSQGLKLILARNSYTDALGAFEGGHHRSRIKYECSLASNEVLFVHRHRDQLTRLGDPHPGRSSIMFLLRRAVELGRGWLDRRTSSDAIDR